MDDLRLVQCPYCFEETEFTHTNHALGAAISGQRAIGSATWPAETGPLRVRMGVHAGESEARDGDFYGTTLNRAARIMSAAHGGQVLLSELVMVSVRSRLPERVSLRDLGEHALRDLLSPERLYQVVHPDLADAFPPVKSMSAFKNNLPLQLTSFVGREAEIRNITGHSRNTRLRGGLESLCH